MVTHVNKASVTLYLTPKKLFVLPPRLFNLRSEIAGLISRSPYERGAKQRDYREISKLNESCGLFLWPTLTSIGNQTL